MPKSKLNLSLCMIARNEEKLIGQCLNSVKDIVDEMIVVDTGSHDRTVEVAQSIGAKVYQHTWRDDFSQARNYSISYANGDWILVLDADEKLAQRDAIKIPTLIQTTEVDGYMLIQRSYLWNANFVCSIANPGDYEEGQGYSNCIEVFVIRLFRNKPEIRYQGRVHELVEPVFLDKPLPYQKTSLVIHHFGKVIDPNHLQNKKQHYLELGRQKASEEPENAMAQFEMGVQLYELKCFQESIPYFERAYQLNNTFSICFLYIAKAHHAIGQLPQADKYYRKCLNMSRDNERVLFEYANFERDQGHLKTAIRFYQKTLSLNAQHALAVFNLGGVYLLLSKIEKGFAFLKKAIRLNPDNETFYENFGRLSLQGCYLEDAASLLEGYLQRFPQSTRCRGLLAEIYFKRRQYEKALHWASKALELDHGNQSLLLIKAHSEFSLGKLDAAEEDYYAVLKQEEHHLDSLMNLAAIAEHRGDGGAAEAWYSQVVDYYPQHALALRKYGVQLAKSRPDFKALQVLERAYRCNVEDMECLLLLGFVYEKNGKTSEAINLYQEAQRRNPKLARLANEKIRRLEGLQVMRSGSHVSEVVSSEG